MGQVGQNLQVRANAATKKREHGNPALRGLVDRLQACAGSTGEPQWTWKGSGTEDLSEVAQELLRYRDDGTAEVHEWVSDIQ